MLRGLAATGFVCTFAGLLAGSTLTSSQRDLNVKSFEMIWTTVRDTHWDPKLGGLNWQAAHDEFLPAVERAKSMEDARAAMRSMLERLGASHFAVIPSDVYSDLPEEARHSGGSTGIECVIIDGKAVVWNVLPGSAAEQAGVRAGWIVDRIGEWDAAAAIDKILHSPAKHQDLLMSRAVASRLEGAEGEAVAITFRNGQDQPVTLALKRTAARGVPTQFGLLPSIRVWIESRRIGGDIGYVRFNQFLDPGRLMKAYGDAVTACLTCKGFIVDLRGNTGGIGGMAMGMAGYFTDRSDAKLGTMIMRQTQLNFVINPRPNTFAGPLAILVDGSSASTSEIFAGGLQDLKRARVFGTKSAGAALPSQIRQLPNGDGFQFAQANYVSEGGKPLEGRGVTPDAIVTQSREALLSGHDRVIDAAVDWIKGKHE